MSLKSLLAANSGAVIEGMIEADFRSITNRGETVYLNASTSEPFELTPSRYTPEEDEDDYFVTIWTAGNSTTEWASILEAMDVPTSADNADDAILEYLHSDPMIDRYDAEFQKILASLPGASTVYAVAVVRTQKFGYGSRDTFPRYYAFWTEDEAMNFALQTHDDLCAEYRENREKSRFFSGSISVTVIIAEASDRQTEEFRAQFDNCELWYNRGAFDDSWLKTSVESFDFDIPEFTEENEEEA